jgi:flagellar motility protein MotE (MotC chaperone)
MAQTTVNTDIQRSKPKKSKAGLAIFIIILILVLVGAGLCYWFNLFGAKTKVLTLMGKDPEQVEELTEDEKRVQNEQYFAEMQADIDAQKAELEQKQAELEQKQNEIDEREQKYLVDKAEFDSLYEAFEKRKMDVKDVAKIYEQMDSAVAADILVKYADKNEVARIISNLTDSKAAEVLSEMDAKYASDLLRVIN